VTVHYYTAGGGYYGSYNILVPPKGRVTIAPRDQIGSHHDFATEIISAAPIVVERPMYFTYTGGMGTVTGGNVAVGLPKPEYSFYFAEGWTGNGFDGFLALYNPHSSSALATVQYMFPGGGSTTKNYWVNPKTRLTLNIAAEIGTNQEVSMRVASSNSVPIVAERPMYFNYYSGQTGWVNGGHVVVGYAP
jgi:hypothetical protein